MAISSDQQKILEVISKFKLHPEDCFIHQKLHLKIIRRSGYKKIQRDLKILTKLTLLWTNGLDSCVMKAAGGIQGTSEFFHRETIGEVSPKNNSWDYPHSVAVHRAEGRLILELAGLREEGFFTEDEVDEQAKGARIREQREVDSEFAINKAMEKMGIKPTNEKNTEKKANTKGK